LPALGLELALEKPFSLVGADALARALKLAADAAAVIVCEVPFGPGTPFNLELAGLSKEVQGDSA